MHPSLLIDVAKARAVDVQYMSKSPLYLHDGNPYEGMLYSALEGAGLTIPRGQHHQGQSRAYPRMDCHHGGMSKRWF